MIELNLDVKFSARQYKSFLNRLKKLGLLLATVGIHANEGKQKVVRRYTTMSKKGNLQGHKSGRSNVMTIAKLAYQNEFGANIPIRPRYRVAKKQVSSTTLHTPTQKITKTVSMKQSVLRGAREQGYLLLNKQGKFVAYFRPNSVIRIPERSFLRKTAKNLDPKVQAMCSEILSNILVQKTLTPNNGMKEIAKLIELKVKQNMRTVSPKNHELTRKAKGFNLPLVDEKDRLLKSIKYKIYRNPYQLGSVGSKAYHKQLIKTVDECINKANQYEQIAKQITTTTKFFTYKRFNPHFLK